MIFSLILPLYGFAQLSQPAPALVSAGMHQLFSGLFYGALLIIALYHLFLFFFVREKNQAYLFYSLYTVSLGLFSFSLNGTASAFPWDDSYWISKHSPALFGNLTIYWGSVFTRRFLFNTQFAPRLDKIANGITWAAVGIAVISIFSVQAGQVLTLLLAICFAGMACINAFHGLKDNYQPALFLLIAWLIFAAGICIIGFIALAGPAYSILLYCFFIFAAFNTMALSMAFSCRINALIDHEKQMKQEIAQAEQSRRFKDQFLANTSHEIRTPMNAIIGFTRLLEQSVLGNSQREYVRHIKSSAENLLVIINDILDFSKIESGKITFEQVNIHLASLCHSIIETLRFKITEKNLDVSYFIDSAIPKQFLGDPVRLNQILLNLLSNAVKFTDEGSVHLKAQLMHETAEDITVLFEVKDTGIGIPEDKISYIFESFSQASDHTTRKYGGTGLGLTIVKQLVELQGGQIQVKSRINEGSTFSVTMLFKKGKFDTQPDTRAFGADTGTAMAGLRILLLEDNPINQIVAINTLQKWSPGIKIDTADNGKLGIDKLAENDYDLMLVDIQMPEMNGYETTRYIRTQMPVSKKNIPIIALTAGALKEDQERALAAGMNDYVSKPFDAEVLFTKIGRLQLGKDKFTNNKAAGNKFDISNVEKSGLGDPEFMVQLMDMFLEKTPQSIAQMEKFSLAKDWKNVSFVAHRIKSVFVCMGLPQLQQELLRIEESAAALVHLDKIPEMIRHLKKGCEEIYIQIIEERDKLVNNNR